jgi:hypothetical protein
MLPLALVTHQPLFFMVAVRRYAPVLAAITPKVPLQLSTLCNLGITLLPMAENIDFISKIHGQGERTMQRSANR